MSGRRARALRKKVYGVDFSPRERRYNVSHRGERLADSFRQRYQQVKKEWRKSMSQMYG